MDNHTQKESNLQSEDAFLALIDRCFPSSDRLLLGRGDDCAVVSCTDSLCVSSDLFLQDVHFRREYFSAEDFGYKALAVNISDIAAMGARPTAFALNLMIPDGVDDAYWIEFFQGMAGLAGEHDLDLVGGDLSRASCLGAAITIWGERVPGGRYLQRAQARPGDVLFIVGEVGLARLGLAQLEESLALNGNVKIQDYSFGRQNRHAQAMYPQAIQAHLRPAMHVAEACALGAMDTIRGLMDVSDGLARDLPRFLGPHLGCRITLAEQDLHPELRRFAAENLVDALEWALRGGEDYALLGAVAAGSWEVLQSAVPQVSRLGDVTPTSGIMLREERILLHGFDHFGR
ncbi:thiamine-monophosphate kinase [Desulfonatronum thiosulfatophilum]|uniref:Thiamine-monophosphate kinase n=1 Tax=Desulfonatronum thiosulfatophilum TaxID=617002 RepID=A0A1G6BB63_9BACT|nr:thiamine-phosphate kinase [Desulfonatronum thiosulfatophilum]SDB17912.1 thiamine-monophosphate kinase [Desulfonatronum thiosulfatophilum]